MKNLVSSLCFQIQLVPLHTGKGTGGGTRETATQEIPKTQATPRPKSSRVVAKEQAAAEVHTDTGVAEEAAHTLAVAEGVGTEAAGAASRPRRSPSPRRLSARARRAYP